MNLNELTEIAKEELRAQFQAEQPVKGLCMDCGLEAKVKGKHKCIECAMRKLTMDEQGMEAIARRSAWVEKGMPKPPRTALTTVHRRFCNGCGTFRMIDRNGTKFDMIPTQSRCRPCASLAARQTTYGGDADQHEKLALLAAGTCQICGGHQRTRALGVDHDHRSGQIRGLICNQGIGNCNEVIGAYHDNPRTFLATAMYLLRPPAGQIFDPDNYMSNKELGIEILNLMKEILNVQSE